MIRVFGLKEDDVGEAIAFGACGGLGKARVRKLAARPASAAKGMCVEIHSKPFATGYRYIYHVCKWTVDTSAVSSQTGLEVTNLQVVLGKRIRELRSKKGFSQESFADHCGLHRTYMGGIERGEHNLTIGTVMTISKALDMSLSELLRGIEKLVESSKQMPRSTSKREKD